MSSAHRPTWDPAQGKDSRSNSKIYSSRDLAAHTRLKFRQPGQGTTSEVQRRDLKLDLLTAERESAARKAKGQSGLSIPNPSAGLITAASNGHQILNEAGEDGEEARERAKRRRVLEEAAALDADDSDDHDDEGDDVDAAGLKKGANAKGKGKEVGVDLGSDSTRVVSNGDNEDDEDDDDDDDDDDDEDETAELLRELEKIKRERAEEKERLEREKAESEQTSREEEIAIGNPLLNLQSALNYGASSPSPSMMSSSASSASFGVKRRWDDDVIFKNQARGTSETPKKEFVNDLLRTEFHKRFMKKFIA